MCPAKTLLQSFVDSNTPQTSTCLLFIILPNEERTFSKICCVQEIYFRCLYLAKNNKIWSSLLVTSDEVWNVRAPTTLHRVCVKHLRKAL